SRSPRSRCCARCARRWVTPARAEWLESRDSDPARMPVRRASMIGYYLDLATCMLTCAVFRFWQRAGRPDPDPAIRTATHAAGTVADLAAGSDRRAAGRGDAFGVSARAVAPQSMPSFFSL